MKNQKNIHYRIITSCSENKSEMPHRYLKTVLSSLEEIESATYDSHGEAWV
ncbi:MAG: hypothetical protein AAF944_27480 [Bacteroidota bacterium]